MTTQLVMMAEALCVVAGGIRHNEMQINDVLDIMDDDKGEILQYSWRR